MATRRDKGTGTIYADKSRGGYRGKITLAGREYVVRGKTRAIVKDKLNALVRDDSTGNLAKDRNLTVAQVVNHYVTRAVPNRLGGRMRPNSMYRYTWAAGHIEREIGRLKAAKLTPRDVEGMLDRLAARPMSRSSLTKIHGTLRAALDAAVRRGEIPKNAAAAAELPGEIIPERPRLSLTVDMAARLLAGLDEERNGAMFAVSMLLGLRPGEAAALYWEDIDGHILNVTRGRQVDDKGRVSIVDELKTKAAKRTLEMPDVLVEMLARHRKRQAEERLAAATWVEPRLVFASSVGTPLNISKVRKQLHDICVRLEVTVDAPNGSRPPLPYELRHTAASLYSANGVPHEVIADLYGLTTTRMIESRYRHRLRPTVAVAREVDLLKVTGS